MGVSDRVKQRVITRLKQQGFYQDLLGQYQRLMQLNHASQKTARVARKTVKDNEKLLTYPWFVDPGHYYSPLVDPQQVDFKGLLDIDAKRTNQKEMPLAGIDQHKASQQALLTSLAAYADSIPDYDHPGTLRYRYDNDQFGRMDAGVLWTMLRHIKPQQVIEVGSGWTSSLMLDVNERFPDTAAKLTFIDPYPDRLYQALRLDDKKRCSIVVKPVQQVPLEQFKQLRANDIMFIDNSHVSKYHSDVNYLFLHVLPSLAKGVIIHVHDIFYPFEYPLQWVKQENRNWNEVYVLHALLIGSDMFEILLWPSYLKAVDQKKFEHLLPTATGYGGSIWLRKIR